tara:strand:- start:771 stop:1070 length:300 start_codon:yes stop_codon:yes gene_type:complete
LRQSHGELSFTVNGSTAPVPTSGPASAGAMPNMNGANYGANDNSFNDIFNYASFMWDPSIDDNMIQASGWRSQGFSDLDGQSVERGSIVCFQRFEAHTL